MLWDFFSHFIYTACKNKNNHVRKNMLQERFWVFLKHFIYKEENGASKIKSNTENLMWSHWRSQQLAKFNVHKSFESGDINFSNCHVNVGHVIKGSCHSSTPCLVWYPWIFCQWK